MEYSKPQVAVLGSASTLIQGSPKHGQGDSGSMTAEIRLDFESED